MLDLLSAQVLANPADVTIITTKRKCSFKENIIIKNQKYKKKTIKHKKSIAFQRVCTYICMYVLLKFKYFVLIKAKKQEKKSKKLENLKQ